MRSRRIAQMAKVSAMRCSPAEPIKTRTSARKKTSQGRSISVLGGLLGMGDDQKLDWRFLGFEFQAQLLLQGGEKRGGIGVTGRPVEFEVVASFKSCPVDNNLLGIARKNVSQNCGRHFHSGHSPSIGSHCVLGI